MKKIFAYEYPDYKLFEDIEKWIKSKTMYEGGGLKVYSPIIQIEIFDQNGEELIK